MAQPEYTPEQIKRRYEAVKRHRARNPSYDKQWRLKNIDSVREQSRAYQAERRLTDKEALYLRTKEWKAKNKDKIREYQHNWKSNHRIYNLEQERKRQARKITRISSRDISNWESRICGICTLLIEGDFHIDHIIPISKGGPHVVSNLQLAHPFCNLSKKDKLLDR